MAEVQKSCVICGGEEQNGELLIAAPCDRHYVCPDDISNFFQRATENESLYPPKCCGQLFILQDYEDYVSFDVQWAFQVKETGEYSVLAKYRVYCGDPCCGKFLHPSTHVKDTTTNLTYASCEDAACGKSTCTGCKTLLNNGTETHVCKKDEGEEKFRQIATEKGYQECNTCGATVELAEACNHITCECGHMFCYVCGKDWPGLHGCPHYGPAVYDEEGYNQDGYHRDSGLNREGLTRRQQITRQRDLNGDDEDEEDEVDEEEDDGEDDDPDWEILQHLDPDQRTVINGLHGEARWDALDQMRILLFETRGIMFGGQAPQPSQPNHTDADSDSDDSDNEDADQNDNDESDADDGAGLEFDGQVEMDDVEPGHHQDSENDLIADDGSFEVRSAGEEGTEGGIPPEEPRAVDALLEAAPATGQQTDFGVFTTTIMRPRNAATVADMTAEETNNARLADEETGTDSSANMPAPHTPLPDTHDQNQGSKPQGGWGPSGGWPNDEDSDW